MAAITHQKLADLLSEVLKYPTFSPDLAPSDYQLFPNFEKYLQRTKFLTTEDDISAAYEWFVAHCLSHKVKDLSAFPHTLN